MNKTLKLLALLVFAGAALNACGGCVEEVKAPEEVKSITDVEETKSVDTTVEETKEVTETEATE